MLAKVVVALAALAVVATVVVALQPSRFRVVRSAVIAAPPPQVFAVRRE